MRVRSLLERGFSTDGYEQLLALLLFAALLAAGSGATAARAQDEGGSSSRGTLHEAFAAGDARAILQDAAGRVEVGVLGNSSQYSRSQAVYVLGRFFDDHPPRRFAWKDTSTSSGSRFLTGRYWHEASKYPLPVYLRLARKNGSWTLQEVRIERP
jgi:hypothetical protein